MTEVMPTRAVVHPPSPRMNDCELTYLDRNSIDCDLAAEQHAGYCKMLKKCGLDVISLRSNAELPDCAFVEDAAIVLGDTAVIAPMGVESRRLELPAIESCLARFCKTVRIHAPAALEGGDVLQLGTTLLVGRSNRTNRDGISALEAIAQPLGWRVQPVTVRGCLHLKTACTAIDDETLLVNRSWIEEKDLANFQLLDVPESEPWSANVLRIGKTLCLPSAHERTLQCLGDRGFDVQATDISELAKAEAGMTCLSVIFQSQDLFGGSRHR